MTHFLRYTRSGAECSCGRTFSVWTATRRPGWSASKDFQRTLNLICATARRHVDAANTRTENCSKGREHTCVKR